MGILDFFKRKKKDDFGDLGDLDSGLNLDDLNKDMTGVPSDSMNPSNPFDTSTDNNAFPGQNLGQKKEDDYELSSFQTPPAFNTSKNDSTSNQQDLVLAKLDSIRSELSNVQLRLDKIEEKLKTRRW